MGQPLDYVEKPDHCTLWVEGTWSHCCKRHDRRYSNNRISRLQADVLLFRCVSKAKDVIMASIMFAGVRMFGSYFYNKANKV